MTTTATAPVRDILDPTGVEEPVAVFYDAEDPRHSICINWKVDMGIEQARAVGRRLMQLADSLSPASSEAIATLEAPLVAINKARGSAHTVACVAAACGVDPDALTQADVAKMCAYVDGTLMHS